LGNEDQAEKMVPDFEGYPTGVLLSRDGKIMKITLGLVSYEEIDTAIQSQLHAGSHGAGASGGNQRPCWALLRCYPLHLMAMTEQEFRNRCDHALEALRRLLQELGDQHTFDVE